MPEQGRVAALGFFDGLHRGHQAVIRRAAELAMKTGQTPCVITFDRRPKNAVRQEDVRLLSDRPSKALLLNRLFPSVELIELPFDASMQATPWDAFAAETLMGRLKVTHAVCGSSFRFGCGGIGNPERLRQLLPVDTVEAVCEAGGVISSTRIRGCMEAGRLAEANRLLGHPYLLTGQAVPGDGRGQQLGFATMNLTLPEELLRPRAGVYASSVRLRGRTYRSITNFGTRPTFYQDGIYDCETHLFSYSGEPTYGETAVLALYAFLRPEQRFANADALVRQIAADIDEAKQVPIPELDTEESV